MKEVKVGQVWAPVIEQEDWEELEFDWTVSHVGALCEHCGKRAVELVNKEDGGKILIDDKTLLSEKVFKLVKEAENA